MRVAVAGVLVLLAVGCIVWWRRMPAYRASRQFRVLSRELDARTSGIWHGDERPRWRSDLRPHGPPAASHSPTRWSRPRKQP